MRASLLVPVVVLSVLAGVIADRLVVGTAARAQESPMAMNIGGESVFIGMPRDTALAKFAGKYEIGNLDDGRVLIGRAEDQPKIYRSVGLLSFEQGKLISAARYWGDFYPAVDGVEPFWNALYGALSQQVGARRLMVELERSSRRQPESQEDWIAIHFKSKDIEIGKLHVNNKNATNFYVRETLY